MSNRQILLRLRSPLAEHIHKHGGVELIHKIIKSDMRKAKREIDPGFGNETAWYPITDDMAKHLKTTGPMYGLTKGEYLKQLLNDDMIKNGGKK